MTLKNSKRNKPGFCQHAQTFKMFVCKYRCFYGNKVSCLMLLSILYDFVNICIESTVFYSINHKEKTLFDKCILKGFIVRIKCEYRVINQHFSRKLVLFILERSVATYVLITMTKPRHLKTIPSMNTT